MKLRFRGERADTQELQFFLDTGEGDENTKSKFEERY